ncbi:MAG: GNAT family N-acetyltransferase [Planctomycetota bacterium]|jgi:GNAT superfamily N-acetyltransferase
MDSFDLKEIMLKIHTAETNKDIVIAKTLFTEYADFLKKELVEYANLPWLVQYYKDFEEEIENLHDGYEPPEGSILLAKYQGQLAGCAALGKLSDGICEMKRLFIREEFQRKGIGTALCMALIEQAKMIGYTRMRLATALEPPKALYKSLGFKEIAPFRDIPDEIKGVDHMELKLI